MGILIEELRLFLIAQTMRLQIQNTLNQKHQDEITFETKLCHILLAKYSPDSLNPHNKQILSQFDQLPSISENIYQRILGIFTPTKEKFLQEFEQQNTTFQSVQKIYSTLKLIAELGNTEPTGDRFDPQIYQQLAEIFNKDLRLALSKINMGHNIEAEIIMDRIITASTIVRSELLNKN